MTQKIPYIEWLVSVRLKFPVLEEFDLASAIYSFQAAYDDGLTPQQAYDDFDTWVSA